MAFAAAVRERLPEVDVRVAAAEQLPFPDSMFDGALAQLVVHFMSDPVDSKPDGLVFNRTVTLRDPWAKLQAKGGPA